MDAEHQGKLVRPIQIHFKPEGVWKKSRPLVKKIRPDLESPVLIGQKR